MTAKHPSPHPDGNRSTRRRLAQQHGKRHTRGAILKREEREMRRVLGRVAVGLVVGMVALGLGGVVWSAGGMG